MNQDKVNKPIPLWLLLKEKIITLEKYHELMNDKINRILRGE